MPTGEIVQTGSSAVTTAGGAFARRFFPSDLTGLFIGAESAFGIVTEATLKMHRWPETNLTRMVEYRDLETGSGHLAQDSGGTEERKPLHPP